jgi:hypothetical protein
VRTVETIRTHLEFLRAEQEVLRHGVGLDPSTTAERALVRLVDVACRSTPKRFAHSLVLVELYGALEQLVEGLIRDYLGRLRSCVTQFQDLPRLVVESHTRKSLALVDQPGRARVPISERAVVENLWSCVSGTDPGFRLNLDAFTLHQANVRSQQLNRIFLEVGVADVLARATSTEPMAHLSEKTVDAAARRLDDIVSFRNEAAHGQPSQVLSLDLLADCVEFVDCLGRGLAEAVDVASAQFLLREPTESIGEVLRVIDDHVVCIRLHQRVE